MPLMHKAVWNLLNHIEFVARRTQRSEPLVRPEGQNRKKDELLTKSSSSVVLNRTSLSAFESGLSYTIEGLALD